MTGLGGSNRSSVGAGVVVGTVGLLFSIAHFIHGISEFPEEQMAALYGVVLPFLVSIAVTASGYWIAKRDWTDVSPWHLISWALVGMSAGFSLIALLILYQQAEGVSLSDPLFTLLMFASYGTAGGLIAGQYHLQKERRKNQLTRQTERLEEFTSIVSHDLRNPLNVASGNLELAKEEVDSEHLDAVERSLSRMEALIEDLLTLARMGDTETELQYIDLEQIVQSCWLNVASGEASLEAELSGSVYGSKPCIKQLFENLLGNATDHGGPASTVTVGDLDDGFYVEDDGPGIPEDAREKVFNTGYTTRDGGTGFGLNIVKQIVDEHGWKIAVTEGTDGGARFEITGVRRTD